LNAGHDEVCQVMLFYSTDLPIIPFFLWVPQPNFIFVMNNEDVSEMIDNYIMWFEKLHTNDERIQ